MRMHVKSNLQFECDKGHKRRVLSGGFRNQDCARCAALSSRTEIPTSAELLTQWRDMCNPLHHARRRSLES